VIVNAAAFTQVDRAEDEPALARMVNSDAAGVIAAAARECGARMIQISTDYVFDGRSDQSYRENAPTNPLGVYGRTKLEGELRVRSELPEAMIVRTSWVYSPFGRNFVRTMVSLAASRDRVSVVADQRGNPSSALDLADGLLVVLRAWRDGVVGLGETYHLSGSGDASWFELARYVFEQCSRLGHSSAEVVSIDTADWPTRAPRPANSMLDCRKFERDFRFRMPPWRASVGRTVERLASARAA
jgi:dTDP-4-dehydrorhamnose reductase